MSTVKKIGVIGTAACLAFSVMSGCGKQNSTLQVEPMPTIEVSTPAPTPTETPVPAATAHKFLGNNVRIEAGTLSRGDEVIIAGETEDNYIILFGEDYLGNSAKALVDKTFIKTDDTKTEQRTVYAGSGAKVYSTAFMADADLIDELPRNTELLVTDELDGILYVEWTYEDTAHTGFIRSGDTNGEPVSESYYSDYGYSGGGDYSDGGYSGGGDTGGGDAGGGYGAEGGDIAIGSLSSRVFTAIGSTFATAAYAEEANTAVCFTDGVTVYAEKTLMYGDTVEVLDEQATDAEYTFKVYGDEEAADSGREVTVKGADILIDGVIYNIPSCYIEETEYEAWTAYSAYDNHGYLTPDIDSCAESGSYEVFSQNDELRIIGMINGLYICRPVNADGEHSAEVYYVKADCVSEEEYTSSYSGYSDGGYVDYGYSGGGDSGGYSGGGDAGGGGGDSGGAVEFWTDPVM